MTLFLIYTHIGVFLAGALSGDALKEFTKFGERLLAFVLVVLGWPVVLWLMFEREGRS